ncbi:hypothetical protein BBO99_00001042 [Phytophthora kernoviae]|uniref:Uncharacterized protein n=1 Tax=Phytophthora kernoviae TaxID=325452 RepID=A0A421EX39_9STRA|nr:hypothetical protein JM18_000331 [Phytophthora kernoviae]RLN06738.1 hypothetical protein BBI17_001013 [Phytophthora kernoviae]RLN84774.1 hypothetical protein BBO99_00001042 [Phytophthora kernoviae]
MRLRAPDEPEAENSYDGEDLLILAPSTPEHTLPPLDVGSPEYIEERLENLKRRPNWGDFLDQYVENHPESDTESESEVQSETEEEDLEAPGFLRSAIWSLLVVGLAPLLIFCSPCLRHKGVGFWPLGCRSMKELFGFAVTNVAFIVFGLLLVYWTICRELPDLKQLLSIQVTLNEQQEEILRSVDLCHEALLQWEPTVAQELCMPVGIDGTLLVLNGWLLLHCHRRWARYGMMMMALMFVVDMPSKLYDVTFPAPEIHKVDPSYALVDEELLVALDGKNLKQGGTVAWVAYWGCATTSNVDTCEKQFPSTFEAGVVPVTFKSLDHFIPCYRDPPNPLKAQDYQCYESVRIRVKDKHSIPGWSRVAPNASPAQRPEEIDERVLIIKKQETAPYIHKKKINAKEQNNSKHPAVKQEDMDVCKGDKQDELGTFVAKQEESVKSRTGHENLKAPVDTPTETGIEHKSLNIPVGEDENSMTSNPSESSNSGTPYEESKRYTEDKQESAAASGSIREEVPTTVASQPEKLELDETLKEIEVDAESKVRKINNIPNSKSLGGESLETPVHEIEEDLRELRSIEKKIEVKKEAAIVSDEKLHESALTWAEHTWEELEIMVRESTEGTEMAAVVGAVEEERQLKKVSALDNTKISETTVETVKKSRTSEAVLKSLQSNRDDIESEELSKTKPRGATGDATQPESHSKKRSKKQSGQVNRQVKKSRDAEVESIVTGVVGNTAAV